jgi:signal transduction histidine kinase
MRKLTPQSARAEWPSFHGSAIPERQDPRALGYDFIRAMHHRLSQPMTALRCSLEVMQMAHERDPHAFEQVTRAIEQSDRVMEFIATFRTLFEADREEVDLCPASLVNVLSEVVDDLRPLARDRAIQIVFPWISVELRVRASRARLRQSLWNVVQNCIELASNGDEIGIHLQHSFGSAKIIITDTSQLAEAEADRIFDPFSFCMNLKSGNRVSNLPLSIMQRIVLAAGGEVQASSDLVGRHFEIRLPVCTVRN